MLFSKWRSIEKQQRSLLKKIHHETARRYLETPLPDKKTPVEAVNFLALDFETTGLNPKKEAILSMGYTRMSAMRVSIRHSRHQVISLNTPLPSESVKIHQITHDRMLAGIPMHEALHELVEEMCGRVLLVHYAPIERQFLQAAMKRVYGHALPFLMVDTLALEKRQLDRRHQPIASNQLRLANLREQYGLPRYGAHDALEDAIATTELFMAECSHLQASHPNLNLGHVLY